jgi:hypothetical protein
VEDDGEIRSSGLPEKIKAALKKKAVRVSCILPVASVRASSDVALVLERSTQRALVDDILY